MSEMKHKYGNRVLIQKHGGLGADFWIETAR